MDQEQVMLEFERRLALRKVTLGLQLGVLFVVPAVLVMLGIQGWAVYAATFVPIAALLYYQWRTWRCPVCHQPLGREWHHRHCSYCGARLSP